ncbi:MerR family transcriptional regulator [Streptomyces sp. NPDC091266]|uniref:MerR family transcriptional regulator n=1 Tax=Streptomyces sp. NPDC091266 TaxID=3365978 RepID=UPI003820A4B0
MRIGELASLAGVSTRAVRHYHHQGLLPEPARRANGYREYGLRDAVALARVRRLTELGLGLEEVKDVLADDAGRELREVLVELDADLARQEEEIRGRRARLAAVLRQAAEHGGLPEEGPVSEQLAELFAQMARTSAALPGPEPAMAAKDREVMALLETAGAGASGPMLDALRDAFTAPGAMERAYAVYGLLDGLVGVAPDDPRVAKAARAAADALPAEVVEAITAAPDGGGGADSGRREAWLTVLTGELGPAQREAVRLAVELVVERSR